MAKKKEMSSIPTVEHRNQEATCYVGNLDPIVDEDLLMELFNHIGRVSSVHMPKDKLTGSHNGYGFVEYRDIADADYAISILNMIKLYGRPLRVSKSSLDKKNSGMFGGGAGNDVGANLFLGNLDPEVDEKILYDTFSAFGQIIRHPRVMRDEGGTNQSKGYGFVSFDCFEASDMAIECMHNQFLCNRQITVQYAFKKASSTDEETGRAPGSRPERHGSRAERMLAANNPMKKLQAEQLKNIQSNNTSLLPSTTMPPPPPLLATAFGIPNAASASALIPGGIPPPPPPHQPNVTGGSMLPPPPFPPPPPPPSNTMAVAAMVGTNTMPPPPLPPPPPPPQGTFSIHHHQTIPPPPPPSSMTSTMPPPPPPPTSNNAELLDAPPPPPPPLQ